MMGMSLNLFKYHISKPDAPQPIHIGVNRHPFYDSREIKCWRPPERPTIKQLPPAYAEGIEARVTAKPRRKGKGAE